MDGVAPAAWLDEADAALSAASSGFRELLAPLSPVGLNFKPSPKGWSVGECLTHLVVVNGLYLPKLEQRVDAAEGQGSRARAQHRPSLLGRMFLKAVSPDTPRRLPTLGMFEPSRSEVHPSVLEDFLMQQERLGTLATRARGVDLSRTKVPSPASSLIRFRLGDLLLGLARHELRHLQQAQRVVALAGFPG